MPPKLSLSVVYFPDAFSFACMKRYISCLIVTILTSTAVLSVSAQESLVSPQQQEACRIESTNAVSQKEQDLQNRLNGFLTSYTLPPLEVIVRSKQALTVFESDLDALCQSYGQRQATDGTVGQACDNRIIGICNEAIATSKERMKVSTKEALYVSSGRQRLFYMAQDINRVSKAINAQSRALVIVDDLLRTVAQKINYFTDKVLK